MSYSALAALAEGAPVQESANGSFEIVKTPRLVPLLTWAQVARYESSAYPESLGDAIDWIECPKKRRGPLTIALKVSGESMEPYYRNGDLIYVDPEVAPIHGKDVVVRLAQGYEVVFKRIVVEGDGRYLKPLNPNWPGMFTRMPNDARIIGVVVGRYADV